MWPRHWINGTQHLQALLKGPQDESARREIASLQQLEESYTMEEERRLHAAALTPDYQEPVPIETEQTEVGVGFSHAVLSPDRMAMGRDGSAGFER